MSRGWARPLAGTTLAFALGAGLAQAQTPTVEPLPAGPTPPTMGDVKQVLKGTVRDVLGGAPPAAAPAAAAPAPQDPVALAQRLAILRKKNLRDEDFTENDETNRDPFRSYMRLFVEKTAARPNQVPALFDKFALEELSLIAIISGDANPRAMFRDPSGLGQVVKKGDYVSKSAGRVTKILSDRVILELVEVTATGEAHPTEKAILVNPESAQK